MHVDVVSAVPANGNLHVPRHRPCGIQPLAQLTADGITSRHAPNSLMKSRLRGGLESAPSRQWLDSSDGHLRHECGHVGYIQRFRRLDRCYVERIENHFLDGGSGFHHGGLIEDVWVRFQ